MILKSGKVRLLLDVVFGISILLPILILLL